MDAKDWNGHTPGEPASPSREAHDDLVALAANALFEFGRLRGRLEAALERIAELAKADASKERM